MTNSKRLSQRASAISQQIRQVQEDTTRAAEEQERAIDDLLREFIAAAPPGERDSVHEILVDVAHRHGVDIPDDITRPTKPSPDALRESRAEPSWVAPSLEIEKITPVHEMAPTSGPKILVIDDDEDTRLTIANVLEEHGFNVYQAQDGGEGFVKATLLPRLDLILLDLMMPRVNGFEFLAAFDKSPIANVPLLIISGQRPSPGTLDPYLNDARVFLGKPLDLPRLIATVRDHVYDIRKHHDAK